MIETLTFLAFHVTLREKKKKAMIDSSLIKQKLWMVICCAIRGYPFKSVKTDERSFGVENYCRSSKAWEKMGKKKVKCVSYGGKDAFPINFRSVLFLVNVFTQPVYFSRRLKHENIVLCFYAHV